VRIGLEFAESVFGCRKEISVRLPAACAACAGRGTAPGTEPVVCTDCQGAGEVRRVRQSLLGQVVTSVACSRCAGLGETIPHACAECGGEGRRMEESTFTVEVPAGWTTALHYGWPSAGQPVSGALHGSLFVHLVVTPDARFERDADNLHTTLTIGLAQAALGTEVEVDTMEGTHPVVVRAGTQHGFIDRIRAKVCPTCAAGDEATSSCMFSSRLRPPLRQPRTSCSASSPPPGGSMCPHPAGGGDGVFSRLRSAFG